MKNGMDGGVRDLYLLLLKYGGEVEWIRRGAPDSYTIKIKRPIHLVDIDHSNQYVKSHCSYIVLRGTKWTGEF